MRVITLQPVPSEVHVSHRFIPGVLSAALLLSWSCAKPSETSTLSTPATYDSRVTGILQSVSGNPNADEISMILGYNDRQAFQRDGVPEYGPVVDLYAIAKLWDLPALQTGQVVAVLSVGPRQTLSQPYTRLQIIPSNTPQLYCVALKKNGGGGAWKGSVDLVTGSSCPSPSWNLNADYQDASGFTNPTDLPEFAARFSDDNAGFPSVVVRCLSGWCEIGRGVSGGGGSPRPPMTPPGASKENKVKTWSDDQIIGEPKAGGGVKRSGTRASITPAADLGHKTHADYQTGGTTGSTMTGIKVATILLDDATPSATKYGLWNLQPGTPGGAVGATDVWMRFFNNTYEAQFVPAGTTPNPSGTWYVAYQTPHSIPVPGTARWIWDPQDEGVWVACEQGCCEISQDLALSAAPEMPALRSPRRRRLER